jgi:hypothetical protein
MDGQGGWMHNVHCRDLDPSREGGEFEEEVVSEPGKIMPDIKVLLSRKK